MQELDFDQLYIDVQESKNVLRVATAGDPNPHITRPVPAGTSFEWEQLARARFPNASAEFHVMQLYKQASAELSESDTPEEIAAKTQLSWAEYVEKIETCQLNWRRNEKFLVSMQEPTKHGRAEDRFGADSSIRRGDLSSGKRQAVRKSSFKSIGIAVNQFFAVNLCQHDQRISLDNPDFKDTAGELWFLCLLDYHREANWQRTRVRIEQCKLAHLSGSTLYLLDGNTLRIVNCSRESNGKLSFTAGELDLLAQFGVETGKSARSISANEEYLLITGEEFGFMLFSVSEGYALISQQKSGPTKTVGVLNGYSFVLGTRGRDVEFWQINPSDRTVQLMHSQTELKPRQTNLSQKTVLLSDTDDLGVFFLYHCPGRLAVGSNRNLVWTQKRPDPVLVQLNQVSPVVAMTSFGDLAALLHYDGEVSIWQFASTGEIKRITGPKLSFEGRTMGQLPAVQWIAMTHEYVFIMTPNGDLWALQASDRIKS